MTEKIFPKGIWAKPPQEKAKSFVATVLNIKVTDAVQWLKENENAGGYVNLNVYMNEKGHYVEKDTWEPGEKNVTKETAPVVKKTTEEIEYPEDDINVDDIPF